MFFMGTLFQKQTLGTVVLFYIFTNVFEGQLHRGPLKYLLRLQSVMTYLLLQYVCLLSTYIFQR